MDRETPSETWARRWFVRGSGVLFLVVIQVILLALVVRYLDAREPGKTPYKEVVDALVSGGWLWALGGLVICTWAVFRKPWPARAVKVPLGLAWSAVILTWGMPLLVPEIMQVFLDAGEYEAEVTLAALFGVPIAAWLLVCLPSRRWLLGPKIRGSHGRPYAASSAYKSSDGMPLWGYRMIFVCLGWLLVLSALACLLSNTLKAGAMIALGIACFCQWRDLQALRFTPAVWFRGLVLLVLLPAAASLMGGSVLGHLAFVFFGLCIINWAAATARDLFFKTVTRPVIEGL